MAKKKTAPAKTIAKKKTPAKPGNAKAKTGNTKPKIGSAKAKTKSAKAKTTRAEAKTRSAKAVIKTRRIKEEQLDSLEPTQEVSGLESGDLEGLSNVESADSESVDELLEEGNAFEAGVVSGVEDAGEHEGREVHTREVPEDDVPEEYLNQD